MIAVKNDAIGTIPCLIVAEQEKQKEAMPTLIYYHGFTSAKEHNLPIAYLLAEKGYRVILPDSLHHGERDNGISNTDKQLAFWDIIIRNVTELQIIKNTLDDEKLLLNNRLGIAGTSMGGITASAALTQYSWIQTAGILMGSPQLLTYANMLIKGFNEHNEKSIAEDEIAHLNEQLESYDLSKRPEALLERPIFFWHGDHDSVVPFNHSYDFYQNAKTHYSHLEHIQFISESKAAHKVSRYAILEAVKWFEQHL